MTRASELESPRKRAAKGEGDRLRVDILDAAERLLAETGDEDKVSIRAIADSVGVTPPSIYRHFEDKDDLVTAVCERRFADLNAAFERAVADLDDPVARLATLGRTYVEFALEHPEHYRVLMMTTSTRAIGTSAGPSEGSIAFGYLVDGVVACQAVGALDPDEDPLRVAVVKWAGVHGLASLLITQPHFEWPGPPGDMIDLLLDRLARGFIPA